MSGSVVDCTIRGCDYITVGLQANLTAFSRKSVTLEADI